MLEEKNQLNFLTFYFIFIFFIKMVSKLFKNNLLFN